MSGADDDETTSTRMKKPPVPILPAETAPVRPTMPLVGRGGKRGRATPDDFGERPDDAPTMFDPNVPTGARGSSDDERRTNQGPAQPDLFPDVDDNDRPTGATVIGKRSAVPGPPKLVEPRVLPIPHGRIDDSSRTNKWEAEQVMPDAEPTGPAMRPAPAPVSQLPIPPVLPLAPGPQSEPLRAVSMKTPADVEGKQARHVREVRMRPIAEVRQRQNQTPSQAMGFLAPPRDPMEARSRRRNDYIIWGSVAVIVAAVVMLAVWFLAR